MSKVYFNSFERVFIIILCCLFFCSELAFAESRYGGPVLGIRSFPIQDNLVYIWVDGANIENPPACMDTSVGYQYVIHTKNDPNKTLLSNIQIAFENYTQVWIFGTGKCNESQSEFIDSANVISKSFPTYPSGETSRVINGEGDDSTKRGK